MKRVRRRKRVFGIKSLELSSIKIKKGSENFPFYLPKFIIGVYNIIFKIINNI